ncbi:lipoprotein [Streptomyces avidinii]
MRTALVRRTVLSASAVSLALLATACGGSGKADAKDDTKPSAPASASAPAAPAAKGKTDAELAGALVAQADLPAYVVQAVTPEETKAGAGSTSDKPACLPLVKAQSLTAQGAATGTAFVKAIAKGKEPEAGASAEEKLKAGMDALGATATAVTLESYEGKGAADAFAVLKGAGAACADGYATTQDGDAVKITKVSPGAPVTAGDEALAYTIDADLDGESISTQLVVVRKGATLASFSSFSLAGVAEQPTAVVTAQVKKLG